MTAGDIVRYTAHPDWGLGIIEWVSPNGRLIVGFETDDGPYRDDFHADELTPAEPARANA